MAAVMRSAANDVREVVIPIRALAHGGAPGGDGRRVRAFLAAKE